MANDSFAHGSKENSRLCSLTRAKIISQCCTFYLGRHETSKNWKSTSHAPSCCSASLPVTRSATTIPSAANIAKRPLLISLPLTVLLGGVSHVVGSGDDVKVKSTLDTVGSGHDPVLVDEGTAAEPGVVHEEGHDPGPLVGGSLLSSDNLVHGRGSLNSALGGEVVGGLLGGGLEPPCGPGDLLDVSLP